MKEFLPSGLFLLLWCVSPWATGMTVSAPQMPQPKASDLHVRMAKLFVAPTVTTDLMATLDNDPSSDKVFNVADSPYNAACDGLTNDTNAISAAVKAAALVNGAIYLPPSTGGCVTNSQTISVPVVTDGGSFKVSTGQTLAVTRGISAPIGILFRNATAGLGTVSFAVNTPLKEAYPQWWGGNPDGVTANQTFITAALASGAKRVFLSAGDWKITAPIVMHDIFVTLSGASKLSTQISAGPGVSAMIKFVNLDSFAGGWIIENIRFSGFSGGNFTGYALDATGHTFIDSEVRNCWFGLSISAKGVFNGKAVDVLFDGNRFELGTCTIRITLGTMIQITNSVFWECYNNIIDLDGATPGVITGVSIVDNIFQEHHLGTAIRARNTQSLVIDNVIYKPNDTIPEIINYFPTVIDLDNSNAIISNLHVTGLVAYLDTDQTHRGTGYVKIKYGIKSHNSIIKLANVSIFMSQWGIYATGPLTLQATNLAFDLQNRDGIYMEDVTGLVSLDHVKIVKPTGTFISQVGAMTADTFIRNSEFYNARWDGYQATGFIFKTTGNFIFNNNTVVRDDAASKVFNFFDATFTDGKAFFDNNFYSAPVALGSTVFRADSKGYREGLNRGLGGRSLYHGIDALPVFANNAAAIAGGLRAGTLYRTGADPDVICVVH